MPSGVVENKFRSTTVHEDPDVSRRLLPTLSSNSALDGELGGQRHSSITLSPVRKTGTNCKEA
jgi:hypothetical protein